MTQEQEIKASSDSEQEPESDSEDLKPLSQRAAEARAWLRNFVRCPTCKRPSLRDQDSSSYSNPPQLPSSE